MPWVIEASVVLAVVSHIAVLVLARKTTAQGGSTWGDPSIDSSEKLEGEQEAA
jgi:hypothetical protein